MSIDAALNVNHLRATEEAPTVNTAMIAHTDACAALRENERGYTSTVNMLGNRASRRTTKAKPYALEAQVVRLTEENRILREYLNKLGVVL